VKVEPTPRFGAGTRARAERPLELEETVARFADTLAEAREAEEEPVIETVPPPLGEDYPPLEIAGQPILRLDLLLPANDDAPLTPPATAPGPVGGGEPAMAAPLEVKPAPLAAAKTPEAAAGAAEPALPSSPEASPPPTAARVEAGAPDVAVVEAPEPAEELLEAARAALTRRQEAAPRVAAEARELEAAPQAAPVEPPAPRAGGHEAVGHVTTGAETPPQNTPGEGGGEPPPRPPPPTEDDAHPAVKWSLLRAAGSESRARATVDHPTLGSLQLDFTLEEGSVDVRVLAPSLVAAIRLERDVDAIRSLLREHGHRLSELEVRVAGFDERDITGTHPIRRRLDDGRLSLTA